MSEPSKTPVPPESILVSVIMATYAGDSLRHFELAVQSVQAQTHRNIEFLIVLDGPIHRETQAFLDRVTLHDDRVQVLPRKVNEGPARARNYGIDRACGDYIAILDADDIAVPERIEKQLAYLVEHNADVVGSYYRVIDGKGTVVGKRQVPVTAEGIRKSFCVFNPIANSTVFGKAAVLKIHPYPEHYTSSAPNVAGADAADSNDSTHRVDKCIEFEDYALWILLARKRYTLLNQPEYLVLFRIDETFIERRTGWTYFQREVRCKLGSIPLYPIYAAPVVFAVVLASAFARLLPPGALHQLYRVRGALRFGNG